MGKYKQITKEDEIATSSYNKRVEYSKKAIDDMIAKLREKIDLQEDFIGNVNNNTLLRKGTLELEDGTNVYYNDIVKDGLIIESSIHIISSDKKIRWEINGDREQYQIFNTKYGDDKVKTSFGTEVRETISDRSQQYNGTTVISIDNKRLMEVVENNISGFGIVGSTVFSPDPQMYSLLLSKENGKVEYMGEYDWETIKRATYDIRGINQMQRENCIYNEQRLNENNQAKEALGFKPPRRKSDKEIEQMLEIRREILEDCNPLLEEAQQVVNTILQKNAEQIRRNEEGNNKEISFSTRLKNFGTNIINKIKNIFTNQSTKQLPEGKVRTQSAEKHKEFVPKTKLLSEMSNDEINEIMEEMKRSPFASKPYDDKQFLEEILKRIGADEELVRRCAENNKVNRIWSCHRLGKLVIGLDGKTEYVSNYTNDIGLNKTTLKYGEGVINIDNRIVYYDKDGNEVNNLNYYHYYKGDKDSRPTSKVSISKNDFGGVTLENNEIDELEKLNTTSIIEFDSNNIEMRKVKESIGGVLITTVERDQDNPFALKETDEYKKTEYTPSGTYISYGLVNSEFPDKLYSHTYSLRHYNVKDIKDLPEMDLSSIDIKQLKASNPKAAKYFEALIKGDQQVEVAGEE